MKMLQQQLPSGGKVHSSKNLNGCPLGDASTEQLIVESWNNANFPHYTNDTTNEGTGAQEASQKDEELSSMLQRYLGEDDNVHQQPHNTLGQK